MSVNLSYSFDSEDRHEAPTGAAQLENTLFRMLAAIRDSGSIGRAAESLCLSYRHVWGYLKKQEAQFDRKLLTNETGKAARLSEFGERLLWAEQRSLARAAPGAESLAARLDSELLLTLYPELKTIAVSASHDLLFGTLRDCARKSAKVLLDIDYVGSAAALERLDRDECVIAGMHLPLDHAYLCRRGSIVHSELGRYLRLGDHKMIRFASRQQGLMVARGNPLGITAIADLLRSGVRFVNRQPGAGTRVLFDQLLRHYNLSPELITGYDDVETTHLSVAATVAAGYATCGFGLLAAAARFNLDFVPVLREWYFIVCRKPQLESESVKALIEVLRSAEFRDLANAIPGYSVDSAGEIISLRRTLPWYK